MFGVVGDLNHSYKSFLGFDLAGCGQKHGRTAFFLGVLLLAGSMLLVAFLPDHPY